MTGDAADPQPWQKQLGGKARRDLLAKRARDPDDAVKLVLVRDMWLTGFDAPCMHTMAERSSLSVRRTLAQLGIPKSTFYAWYRRHLDGGPEALEDRKPAPRQVPCSTRTAGACSRARH